MEHGLDCNLLFENWRIIIGRSFDEGLDDGRLGEDEGLGIGFAVGVRFTAISGVIDLCTGNCRLQRYGGNTIFVGQRCCGLCGGEHLTFGILQELDGVLEKGIATIVKAVFEDKIFVERNDHNRVLLAMHVNGCVTIDSGKDFIISKVTI